MEKRLDPKRIAWLHRLGVDVWLARDSQSEAASESDPQSSIDERESSEQFRDNKAESRMVEQTRKEQTSQAESEPEEVQEPEVPTRGSVQPLPEPEVAEEEVRVQLICLACGDALVVVDQQQEDKMHLCRGIAFAMSGYTCSDMQQLSFEWPPGGPQFTQQDSRVGGMSSVQRAMKSLVVNQKWEVKVLLIVGDLADQASQSLQQENRKVIKIPSLPTSSQAKRHLWQQILEQS